MMRKVPSFHKLSKIGLQTVEPLTLRRGAALFPHLLFPHLQLLFVACAHQCVSGESLSYCSGAGCVYRSVVRV